MTGKDLVEAAIRKSGLPARQFARRVVGRSERTVRGWLAGGQIPADAEEWLRRYVAGEVEVGGVWAAAYPGRPPTGNPDAFARAEFRDVTMEEIVAEFADEAWESSEILAEVNRLTTVYFEGWLGFLRRWRRDHWRTSPMAHGRRGDAMPRAFLRSKPTCAVEEFAMEVLGDQLRDMFFWEPASRAADGAE